MLCLVFLPPQGHILNKLFYLAAIAPLLIYVIPEALTEALLLMGSALASKSVLELVDIGPIKHDGNF